MNHRIPRCIAACLLASACAAQATELVYTPVNPAFGGNPLNGTWLLNNAQAQNDYDDPDLKFSREGLPCAIPLPCAQTMRLFSASFQAPEWRSRSFLSCTGARKP